MYCQLAVWENKRAQHIKRQPTRAKAIYNVIEATDAGRSLTASSESTNFYRRLGLYANRPRSSFMMWNVIRVGSERLRFMFFVQALLEHFPIENYADWGFIDCHKYVHETGFDCVTLATRRKAINDEKGGSQASIGSDFNHGDDSL